MTTADNAARRNKPLELTIAQAAAVFGVSQVTIFSWKKGTPRRDVLPVTPTSVQTNSPRFFASVLRRYAAKYDLTIAQEPEDVVANWQYVKPGPKPKLKVADGQQPETTASKGELASTTAGKTSNGIRKKPRH